MTSTRRHQCCQPPTSDDSDSETDDDFDVKSDDCEVNADGQIILNDIKTEFLGLLSDNNGPSSHTVSQQVHLENDAHQFMLNEEISAGHCLISWSQPPIDFESSIVWLGIAMRFFLLSFPFSPAPFPVLFVSLVLSRHLKIAFKCPPPVSHEGGYSAWNAQ